MKHFLELPRFMSMRKLVLLGLTTAALLVAAPAFAFQTPEANAAWPTPHQQQARYAENERQPYPMNYSDQAAKRLGVEDGQWEAFKSTSTADAGGATLKGGFNTQGAVLRLTW